MVLEIEKLRKNPAKINSLKASDYAQGIILESAAQKLLEDFAVGRAAIPPDPVLEDWLISAGSYWPGVCVSVIHWVTESLYQRSQGASPQSRMSTFIQSVQLIYKLAKWISAKRGNGIPEGLYDSFPGLSTRMVSFRSGEVERAKKWLGNWLRENAQQYLKICDPYFGTEQIEYFVHVPLECRILVITTDQKLPVDDLGQTKQDLEYHWREFTTRDLPKIHFIVVPHELEDKFHDRAIISLQAGLNIGPSLNGLGTSFQNITVLSEEDAKELEVRFIDKMLNNATWFMDGVHPVIFSLGV